MSILIITNYIFYCISAVHIIQSTLHFLSQDKINWSAPMYGSSQLCTAAVMQATGSNPDEAQKPFVGLNLQLLKL